MCHEKQEQIMDSKPTKIITPDAVIPQVNMANCFSVKKGKSWGPRSFTDFLLIYVISGTYRYRAGNKTTDLGLGDILCIPPGTVHTLRRTDTEQEVMISYIHMELHHGSWLSGDYRLTPTPPLVTKTSGNPVFQTLFMRCSDTIKEVELYREKLLSVIAKELWLRMATIWKTGMPYGISPRMKKMQVFVRKHLAENITRHDIAEAFHLTPEYVNALFKKELGMSPGEYLNRQRVLAARDLLSYEGLSVKEVAYHFGFCDPFYFSKVFKKIMGVSPGRVSSSSWE